MPDGVGARPFAIDEHVDPRSASEVTLSLTGELDASATPLLGAAVERALERRPRGIAIEMSRLTFVDSRGIQALLRARDRCDERGATLVLRSPTDGFVRMLDLLGLREVLPVHGEGW